MKIRQLKKSIPANITDAKNTVSELLNFLINEQIPLSENEFFDLKLVFSELIYNAVLHGNNADITKKVDIDLNISDSTIFCEISDEGSGFDYAAFISTFQIEDNSSLFDEHGRGIRLVLSLVDELNFNETGNSIKFSKRLNING